MKYIILLTLVVFSSCFSSTEQKSQETGSTSDDPILEVRELNKGEGESFNSF